MSRSRFPLGWLMVLSLTLALMMTFVPLPDAMAFARPALVPLVTFFWVINLPRRVGLFTCWCLGLLLDILYDTPLGQHALALVLGGFLMLRFSEYIRAYRLWQQGLLLLPIFLIYQFVLFWIDGLSGHAAEPLWRWAPAFTSAACWPPLCEFLRRYTVFAR